MAIGVVLEFEGVSLDQYDELVKRMGFTPGGKGAPGGLFHWVSKSETGLRVTDVWQSQEIFDKFAQEKIGPLSQEVGITAQPKITFFEVHNYLTAG